VKVRVRINEYVECRGVVYQEHVHKSVASMG